MPELPEIETIKRDFNQTVKGKVFNSVEILNKKIARFTAETFQKKIKGKRVEASQRFAKILIIRTTGKFGLMIHLKMTGQLIYQTKEGESVGGGHPDKLYYGRKLPHKYTQIIFRFKDQSQLFFNDLRRFGWIKIINLDQLDKLPEIEKLGVEPISKKFTVQYLIDGFNRRSRSNIKNLLMDQSFIAGIGNIYASESLFKAMIDPRRRAGELKEAEIAKLHQAIRYILKKAIRLKGTSIDSYIDLAGQKGGYLPQAYVYGRGGRRCRNCLAKIKKIRIGNRGTYFCPQCQK
jgi:formamidopyrimidine-DNA glycosylase